MSSSPFQPDWRLDPPDAMAIHVRMALHRRGIKWGEALAADEQWSDLCADIIEGMAKDHISPIVLLEQPREWDDIGALIST